MDTLKKEILAVIDGLRKSTPTFADNPAKFKGEIIKRVFSKFTPKQRKTQGKEVNEILTQILKAFQEKAETTIKYYVVDTNEFEKNAVITYKEITCIIANIEKDRWKSLAEKYEKMMTQYTESDCNPKLYNESLASEYIKIGKQIDEAYASWAAFLVSHSKLQATFPNEMLFFGHIVLHPTQDAVESQS